MTTLSQLAPSQPTTWLAGAKNAQATQASAGQAAPPSAMTPVNATASTAGSQAAAAAAGSTQNANASMASSTGYNAQTGVVDPATMTSAGQMASITGRDSPNMRRAAEEGLLQAGKRGLENSSFAAGAAQGAMVDRATPLAQQDANTYYQNLRGNLDATNRAAEVSTGRETDVSLANAQLGTNVSLANASQANQMSGANAQLQQQVNLANAAAANEVSKLNAQLSTAVSQQNAQEANRIKQQIAELQNQVSIRNAELQNQVNLQNADAQTRTSMFNAELGSQTGQFNAQQRNAMTMQISEQLADLNKQYLAGTQSVDLANIQGRYSQLISSNQSAGQMYDSYLTGLASIMQNKDISPDRVAQYVNVLGTQLEGGLEFIDAINAIDIGAPTAPETPALPGTPTAPTAPAPTAPAPTPSPTNDPNLGYADQDVIDAMGAY